ncbi:MAG TPA: type II secretion system F family protein [Rhizomicrobium sp.]|nr:type II secretion system F family protein [Rhizomicrobium sp.]
MIRVAILAISVVAALAIVLLRYRSRSVRLRRLGQLVVVAERKTVEIGERPKLSFEQFLPQTIARDLRILEIDPVSREAVAAVAAYMLAVALVARFAGLLAAVTAAAAVLVLGVATLNILAGRRLRELGALMPAFFDRVRQLLAVGNSLPTAFSRAVQSSQPRLIGFFTPALRRVSNGAGFAESVRQSAEDVSLYEMHLFSAAVSTNMRFGGSLTHSLNNLIQFLRKRASVERELRASTSLIRTSAWVLGLLPILVAALIVSQNQQYAHWFIADPTGKMLLIYCIFSQIIGALVMRAIAKTEF